MMKLPIFISFKYWDVTLNGCKIILGVKRVLNNFNCQMDVNII